MEQLEEIVKEFLVESYESLDQLDRDLLALEEIPDDRDRLASIFRTIHTIKGTSGFLAFPKLEHVTHIGENLLVPLRDGQLRLTNEIADGLLAMVDAVRQILQNIESIGTEGVGDYDTLLSQLESLRTGNSAPPAKPAKNNHQPAQPELEVTSTSDESSFTESTAASQEPVVENKPTKAAAKKRRGKSKAAQAPPELPPEPPKPSLLNEIVVESFEAEADLLQDFPHADSLSDAALAVTEADDKPKSARSRRPATANGEATEGERGGALSESTVRLDVQLLDKLMNLVGELVLARNQILQFSRTTEDVALVAASQRLNHITTELQEGVMKTRMQPIRNAWSKLPRVVRDLSIACGKRVEVRMDGAETELDKTILEAIKDPLTHIVRNAVDHGIESPDKRLKNGKPAQGTLWLRAFHESGQVIIEVADDGGGINLDRVKEKAIFQGLVSAEQAQAMNDRELMNLILMPGFSTAEKVTNVSGRGVGMDVVKTNVEKIGGTLDIHSSPGRGTTLRIKIPLTLAIVPALIVTADNDRYAIPQVSLLELVRLEGKRARHDIEMVHNVPVYRLRGRLLPLVFLDEQLELRTRRKHDHGAYGEVVNIVVLQAGDRPFGLVVDQINDTQEIVVKPLGQHLKGITIYAGATIMGDGTVALILDVIGLAKHGSILTETHERSHNDGNLNSSEQLTERQSLLLVDPGDGTRTAFPLQSVARLEEFQAQAIEHVDGRMVVQYRGGIMPLAVLPGSGGGYGGSTRDTVQVVVHNQHGHDVGIVVGTIIDIVDNPSADSNWSETSRDVVLRGRVTRCVDLDQVVAQELGHIHGFGAI